MNRGSLFVLCAGMWLTGCDSQRASSPPVEDIIAQWSGSQGGGGTSAVQIIETREGWEAFWKQVERDPPQLFKPERERAVAISLGARRTGGYGVAVSRAKIEDGKLVVEYRESTPGPEMRVTQALTAPWAVVLLPRSERQVIARKIPAPTTGSQP